jgi:hypothetical protein
MNTHSDPQDYEVAVFHELLMNRRVKMKHTPAISLAVIFALLSLTWIAGSQEQKSNMTFFITSVGSGKGADLGGLAGADKHCQSLAQAAGTGNRTWRAYLSASEADGKPAVNARDRVGKGPWQNAKGVVIAKDLDELCTATTIRSTRKLRLAKRVTPSTRVATNRICTTSSPAPSRTVVQLQGTRIAPAVTGPTAVKAPP